MGDNREAWQIEYSLMVQIAAGYLTELDIARADPQRAAIYCAAYRITDGGLEQWALGQIARAISKANAILAEYNQDARTIAPTVSGHLLERLVGMGLRGHAPSVATTKTDGGVA